MCGFREPEEITRRLEDFLAQAPFSLQKGLEPLVKALEGRDVESALKRFLAALFDLPPHTREELTGYIKNAGEASAAYTPERPRFSNEWEKIRLFTALYPNDPAVIAPLYLNLIDVEPGEAVYLPAGVLHAYVQGFGVELMANSDNVLRGGLTSKHVDPTELLATLNFAPFKPEILKAEPRSPSFFSYASPCEEFSLSVMRGRGGGEVFPVEGPAIVIVTDGTLHITGDEAPAGSPAADLSAADTSAQCTLERGESAFIPARRNGERLRFSGVYTLYAATAGARHRAHTG
jgi:mannose-6-phosphate isomerase